MASITKLSALAPLAVAAALLGSTGCNNDPGSGTVTINYRFGIGASSCTSEGVGTVRISFGDEERTEICNDAGEIVLSGIEARNYNDFVVEGIDGQDITIRDNLDAPDDDESLEVIDGASTSIDVTLTPTPAQIEVTFILLDANGVPYVPSAQVPIDTFKVEAAEGSSSLLLEHEYTVSNLESATNIVPDEERDLDGERVDTVVVSYDNVQVDADPSTTDLEAFTFDPPGDGRLIQIRVTCNGDMCSGELIDTDQGGTIPGGGSDTDGDTDSGTGG
ncbi:MAG: hypothetical protein ACRBN8_00835 [Nannocystales bacterium]